MLKIDLLMIFPCLPFIWLMSLMLYRCKLLNHLSNFFFVYLSFFYTDCCFKLISLKDNNFLILISWLTRHTYLNMNMKRAKREKNVATLSIVFSMTSSWRLSAGMKRTSLRIRINRNVLSTDSPPPPWFTISITL